jgi:uncharacterized protein YxeA
MIVHIILLLIIIIVEIYYKYNSIRIDNKNDKNNKSNNEKKENFITIEKTDDRNYNNLSVYNVRGNKTLKLDKGTLIIKGDVTAIIKIDNHVKVLRKDIIYNIDKDFVLEFINLNSNKIIKYEYISY